MECSNISKFVTHVNSISHLKCSEVFYAAGLGVPNSVTFPSFRIQAFPKSKTIEKMRECPYITLFYSKSEALDQKAKRQRNLELDKAAFRNFVFAKEDYRRQQEGDRHIFTDPKATQSLDEVVDLQWNSLKKLRRAPQPDTNPA